MILKNKRKFLYVFLMPCFLFSFLFVSYTKANDVLTQEILERGLCPLPGTTAVDAGGKLYSFDGGSDSEAAQAGYTPNDLDKINADEQLRQEMVEMLQNKCGISRPPDVSVPVKSPTIQFKPEVGFPGFTATTSADGSLLGAFIGALFQYLLYACSVLAVVMISIAGFQWVASAGNASKISDAKNKIMAAVTGLVLCFASVVILQTINIDLVNLNALKLEDIQETPFPPVVIDREYLEEISEDNKGVEVVSGGDNKGSYNPTRLVNTTPFTRAVIDGIKSLGMDNCAVYAVVHQESHGQVGAIGIDADVPRCDMKSRRLLVCKWNPPCCPQTDVCERCLQRVSGQCVKQCSDIVHSKAVKSNITANNYESYANIGYTFGLGLTQITNTVWTPGCRVNRTEPGIMVQGKCYSFTSLRTIRWNLMAFKDSWNNYYCPRGTVTQNCFANMAGGDVTDEWPTITGTNKKILYDKCVNLGFENIATRSVQVHLIPT